MKNRVLDTCILLDIWHGRSPSKIRVRSDAEARSAPKEWLKKYPNDAILTPIRLEFLGGTRDKDDLRLADVFLDEFAVIDHKKVLHQDWDEAERIARRIRDLGRSRGAIDSLVRAICKRINADLYTVDTGMSG